MKRRALLAGLLAAGTLSFAAAAYGADSAGGWELADPASGGKFCRAAKHGGNVDVHLLRSREGVLMLIAGRPDWHPPFGKMNFALGVDDKPSVEREGTALDLMVIAAIDDDALVQKVRQANRLTWHFAWGDFSAPVAGLGAAFDALAIC